MQFLVSERRQHRNAMSVTIQSSSQTNKIECKHNPSNHQLQKQQSSQVTDNTSKPTAEPSQPMQRSRNKRSLLFDNLVRRQPITVWGRRTISYTPISSSRPSGPPSSYQMHPRSLRQRPQSRMPHHLLVLLASRSGSCHTSPASMPALPLPVRSESKRVA